MKKLLKYAFLLGMSLSVFTACKETYDMTGIFEQDDVYANNYVYTRGPAKNTYNYEFRAVIDENGSKTYEFLSEVENDPLLIPAQITKPVCSDMEVKFAIAPELLSRYNAEHDSDYSLLESATFESDVLVIPAGEQMSADSLRVVYDETEFFNMKGHYAVPVRIVSTGKGGTISSNYNEFILLFNAKYNTSAVAWSETSSSFNLMFDRKDGSVYNPTPSLEYPVTLKTQYAALEDNKVSVRINNDLVKAYNAANDTSYYVMDDVKLTGGSEFTIAAGETETSGTLTLSFSDSMTSLTLGRNYLIPIEISDAEGYGAGVGESNNVYYVFVSTINTPNMAAATSAVGTVIDRTNITGTYYSTTSANPTISNWTTYLTGKSTSNLYMYSYNMYTIDLGAEYTITSFEFNSYYYSYYDYYYSPKIMSAQASTDNITWDDWGDSEELIDGGKTFVEIRYPAPVRYIRLQAKTGWHGSYAAVLDGKQGMNFYQQEN